jgi:SAM-dependent methyltransferase
MTIQDEVRQLRQYTNGFMSAQVVLTANRLAIFSHLQQLRSASDVAASIGGTLRGVTILLDALVGLGLLIKEKELYRNTLLADHLLVVGSPHYQGHILGHLDTMWRNWSDLERVVITGRPARNAHDHDSFIRGMDDLAKLKAGRIIDAIDLSAVRTALDIGGGPGTYSREFARRGISVTLFDLPDTIAIARQIGVEADGPTIAFQSGDCLSDSLGSGYDLIFCSQLIHAFSPDETARLFASCQKALVPGGRLVVQEFLIADDMTQPPAASLFSVNMLVATELGRCYPTAEIRRLMTQAGLTAAGESIVDETVLVTGRR